MYNGRKYELIANYGLESECTIDYRAKSLKGARAGAIKWLKEHGTHKDRVTVKISGRAVGYVFIVPLPPRMRKVKGQYASYGWYDAVNGFVALNVNGSGRYFEKPK